MSEPLIEVKALSKGFDGQTVLDRVSLKLFEGQVMAIIGKSGVGKSVLLKHLVGLLAPDEGQILFRGQPLHRMNAKEMDAYLAKVSYMFQNNALFNSLTVYQNVAMPLRYRRGIDAEEIAARVTRRLEQMELGDAAAKYPEELSGGMQKRVALARALVSDPDIVLFDEPTTGQDPVRKNAILGMIAAQQQQNRFSAILISHDMPDIFFIADTVLALYEGRIIFAGPPEEFERFEHPFRTEFVHSLELLREELTGLYSRRQFKIRYQADLVRRPDKAPYTVVLFRIEDLPQLGEGLGQTAAQELLAALGSFINKHFSEIGGFSTRFSRDQFVTVLPHADADEARRLITLFVEDLEDDGIGRLERVMPAPPECTAPAQLVLSAGLAQGEPQAVLDTVLAAARDDRQTLVRLAVACREETR